jgi:hypothetical protein
VKTPITFYVFATTVRTAAPISVLLKTRCCCQSNFCRCAFILLAGVERKISLSKDLNDAWSIEAITKGVALVKQPEGVINNELSIHSVN